MCESVQRTVELPVGSDREMPSHLRRRMPRRAEGPKIGQSPMLPAVQDPARRAWVWAPLAILSLNDRFLDSHGVWRDFVFTTARVRGTISRR